MSSLFIKNIRSAAIAATLLACLTSVHLFAQTANVTYAAVGKFSAAPVSGNDLFQLAGNTFKMAIVGSESAKPVKSGKGYAAYAGLKMQGSVQSGLVPGQGIPLTSTHTFVVLALGASSDTVEIQSPVTVLGQTIMITAKFTVPKGTLAKPTIWPFTHGVALTPSSGTVTYSDSSATTTLTVATGSLTAK